MPSDASVAPSRFFDFDHPEVAAFAREAGGDATDPAEIARRLYHAVRDGIRYNPYVPLVPGVMSASYTLEARENFCVPKAVLLASAARYHGIPAKVGFADVKNHLSSERLRKKMGTDLFIFHGYTALWLGERWVKATPTFNRELCDRFGVMPLDFDGVNDALFHAHDAAGQRHMEYVHDRGLHDDLPLREMFATWQQHYPNFRYALDEDEDEDEAFA